MYYSKMCVVSLYSHGAHSLFNVCIYFSLLVLKQSFLVVYRLSMCIATQHEQTQRGNLPTFFFVDCIVITRHLMNILIFCIEQYC